MKVLKILGIVLLAAVLLLTGALIYLDRNVEKIAADFLEKEYRGSEISKVYEINYSNIKIGLFSGFIKIEDLEIIPRDSFFIAPDSLRFKYPLVYKIIVPEFSISGLSENFSLHLKDIQLNKIRFDRPQITMIDHLSKEDNAKLKELLKARETTKDTIKGNQPEHFSLSGFEIKDGSFSFFSRIKNRNLVTAGKINIEIFDLDLSPGHIVDALLDKTFEKAHISLADITYPLNDGFYTVEIGEILNNVGDKIILINDLNLLPQYDKLTFGKQFGSQTDRMELSVKMIEIDGFDPEKLIMENEIYINSILIDHLNLNAFRDKNVAFDYSRYPKHPQQNLANLNLGLNIRKIEIRNSEVLYEQMAEGGQSPGKVPIKNFFATITNVSNIRSEIDRQGSMKWDIQANLFDAGLLELEVKFPSDITKADFSFTGNLSEMDMTAFNSMIQNTEYLRIESGYLKSMTFAVEANEDFAEGEMVMVYDSLNISGLRYVIDEDMEKLGFLSALANVVIRNFNPPRKSKEKPKPVKIFFERDKNKGIFNYLAKSMISGIKATIIPGVGSPKKRYEKEKARDERQEDKLNRKEERKQRREEKKEARKKLCLSYASRSVITSSKLHYPVLNEN